MAKKNGKNELNAGRNKLLNVFRKILAQKRGKARDEFRYNVHERHKNYVISVDERHDEWLALGLTSQETTGGVKNMPLSKNPQKGKTDTSFLRNGEIIEDHKAFSDRVYRTFEFAIADIPHIKAKKRNAKKNLKRKKSKKKKK